MFINTFPIPVELEILCEQNVLVILLVDAWVAGKETEE